MTLATAFASLATRVSAAVGGPYWSGAVITPATDGGYDDDGNYVPGSPPTETPCRVQIDAIDVRMRPEGFTDGDYRFLILAGGFTGTINTDASVRVDDASAPADFQGQWAVSGLQRDPVGIGWAGKGRRS